MRNNDEELAEIRRALASGPLPVTWTKPEINAVLEALEAWHIANPGASLDTLSGIPSGVTVPPSIAVTDRKRILRAWAASRQRRIAPPDATTPVGP